MMNCNEVREMFWAFCEGSANEAGRAAVEGHLAGCAACRRDRAAVERAFAAMRGLPEISPSADFQAGVWRRIDAWEARRGAFWLGVLAAFVQRNRRVLATSLVAFAVALVGGLYVINSTLGPDGQVAQRSQPTGYEGVGLDAVRPVAGGQNGVRPDYVLRDIQYPVPLASLSREGASDTVYTRYPTRDLTPPGGLPSPTYVYEPVATPVMVTEPVF